MTSYVKVGSRKRNLLIIAPKRDKIFTYFTGANNTYVSRSGNIYVSTPGDVYQGRGLTSGMVFQLRANKRTFLLRAPDREKA